MAFPHTEAGEVEAFIAAYHAALRAGALPRGAPVYAGHRGACAIAADRLGLTRNQQRSRERGADRMHPGWEKAPPRNIRAEIQAPTLPSHEGPIEDLIARRIAEFERKKKAEAARRWMRFKVRIDGAFGLAFVGDPHIDDDGCDMPLLVRHLDVIERTPGLFGVGMGDWTNNWTGRLARLKGAQGVSDSQAWKLAEWMLKRPLWMLLLRGNHDMWSGAGDPLKWICNGAAPLVDWAAQFEVEASGQTWRVSAAHDFAGHSLWNNMHAPLREARLSGHDADVYVAAHRHVYGLAEVQDEKTGRTSLLMRARGYKAMDSYALVHGYGQQQSRGQTVVAVLDPATRGVRGFSDVEEAAEFLTWLRKRGSKRAA